MTVQWGLAGIAPAVGGTNCGYVTAVFFLFGYGSKQKFLGDGQTRTCPRCHNTTTWSRMDEFKQLSVFFVPVARWKHRRYEICGICGTAVAS